MFGFVKTTYELEAGKIILNAKEKGGLATKIRMSINGKNHSRAGVEQVVTTQTSSKSKIDHRDMKQGMFQTPKNHIDPDKVPSMNVKPQKAEENLGTKVFEFTEANLADDEIMEGLYETRIGISRLDESSGDFQSKLESAGIEKVKIVGLNERNLS